MASARACLFQTLCLERQALVRLCPQEMYLVCLAVVLLEAVWRVALLQVK